MSQERRLTANPIPPLRRRLMVLGKTQAEVAKDVNVTRATISEYVNGLSRPAPKRIRRLALALELTQEQLVDLLAAT